MLGPVDKVDKSGVGVGLGECEVHLIVFVIKVILEAEGEISLIFMMLPGEIDFSKGNIIASFVPSLLWMVVFLDREDWNEHSLGEEVGLLDEVDNIEPSNPSLLIPESKEEPIIIAVGVKIVFHKQIILIHRYFCIDVSTAEIAPFKVWVQPILLAVIKQIDFYF